MSRSGGTERCTAFLANELCKKYKVNVIDISNNNCSCYFDLHENISISHLKAKNIVDGMRVIYRYLRKKNIDVLINVEAMLGIYSMIPCKILGIKNIIWEHGNFFQKQCKSIDKVRTLEFLLCDNYITLTQKDRENFKRNFKGKCCVDYIYNPIILPDCEVQYSCKAKKILSVGIVREIKGFDMLVDVADIVLKKHPDWTWEIYGNKEIDLEYTKLIQNKIKKLGLQNNLFLKGNTKNIESCYKSSSMIVMTSRMEGLPMTLLEAKAHKLPMVSFDIETGPSEIIEDNVNGFLIEPYNTKEMANKICKLIENGDLRQTFSDNAHIGIDKFNINNIIKKWIDVIEG